VARGRIFLSADLHRNVSPASADFTLRRRYNSRTLRLVFRSSGLIARRLRNWDNLMLQDFPAGGGGWGEGEEAPEIARGTISAA